MDKSLRDLKLAVTQSQRFYTPSRYSVGHKSNVSLASMNMTNTIDELQPTNATTEFEKIKNEFRATQNIAVLVSQIESKQRQDNPVNVMMNNILKIIQIDLLILNCSS